MDLDRFIQDRLTKPLGMTSKGFYTLDADHARIAQPQIDQATGKRPPFLDPTQKPTLFSGGGGPCLYRFRLLVILRDAAA